MDGMRIMERGEIFINGKSKLFPFYNMRYFHSSYDINCTKEVMVDIFITGDKRRVISRCVSKAASDYTMFYGFESEK